MKRRTYAIPIVSTVGVTLAQALTACSPAITGDWELRELNFGDGDVYTFPMEYSYSYDGYEYSYSAAIFLTVERNLDAELRWEYSYSYNGQVTNSDYTTPVDVEQIARRRFDIDIEGDVIECDVAVRTMECVDATDDSYTFLWEKR
jgi:hypothetical protein